MNIEINLTNDFVNFKIDDNTESTIFLLNIEQRRNIIDKLLNLTEYVKNSINISKIKNK